METSTYLDPLAEAILNAVRKQMQEEKDDKGIHQNT